MRLLSLSFLVASLAVSLPVQSAEPKLLSPDTFGETVASGYWFVEHFSPYCHHCRAFAPTWDALVEDYAGSRVNFAQVDCAVNGDLCTKNGVNAYPQMNLYHDGVFQAAFDGARSYERIVDFIKERTGVSGPSLIAPLPELSKQEPEIPHNERNPHGEVLALTPETFPNVTADGDVFVKFFAPWCGHCKKLAPTWVKLAKELQHTVSIAEVNCEDHKSLCSTEGVTGFPMLFFYPSSGKKTEYTGNRRFEALKGWVERAMKPVFLDLQFADFTQVVQDNSALYLALHLPSVTLPSSVSQAARPLMGSPPIYVSSAPELFDRFSIPADHDFALIALKDGDTSAAAQLLFSSQTSARELDKWLQAHRWPSALELGEGSFQEVMNAESKPLVVLVSVTDSGAERDRIVTTVRKLATQWRKTGAVQYTPAHSSEARQVVFTWMDQGRWANWLKSMYGINSPARVVITDHSRLVYYDQTRAGSRLTLDDTILPALGDAMRGALSVRHSENIIERLARYINKKFIAVEGMVSDHPWVIVAFFVLGVLVVFSVIKRLFLDEENYGPQPRGRKEARLD
ncbi:thioredoxin-domain-containing protein [Lactarius akahatsu]|uniref:Thioredoxin-domain-containing protein n=1 Tax=Lactarius akahatsu TaxID=416441 RepID=A0AAD4LUC8_9AGAM|nr:thioredoxin-domain-containing protein [Lactarius akahatsu]